MLTRRVLLHLRTASPDPSSSPSGLAAQDEVRALTRINSLFFTTGYLGYLAVWILDTIHRWAAPKLRNSHSILKTASMSACVAAGLEQPAPQILGSIHGWPSLDTHPALLVLQ